MSSLQATQYLNPDGVIPVFSPGLHEVEVYIDLVLEEPKRVNCYTGPSGTGKTFAVSLALEGRRDEVRTVYCALRDSPTRLSLMKNLALALGVELPGGLNAQDAGVHLLDHLNPTESDPRKLCLVIDECQHMKSTACVEVLRGMLEHDQTSFTLLLIGGNGARSVLESEPMVWNRMVAPCPFRTLTEDEVVEILPGYCPPFYEGVDETLLRQIDRERCKGVFRTWARFTGCAQHIGKFSGITKLDDDLYRAVMQTSW